jgi:hypothetical protein
VRNASFLERLYNLFAEILLRLHPLLNWIGYDRIERPVAALESGIKGFMFDCRMCGICALRSAGMSCPMNCPKTLRNGPCGGVRANGHCEVKPEMRCVWVDAWDGAQRMAKGMAIANLQRPIDHHIGGSSSWLRVTREAADERAGGNA